MGVEVDMMDYDEPVYETSSLDSLELFLNDNYEFRYDVIKGMIQYRQKTAKAKFTWLTDRDINTIWRYAMHKNIKGASSTKIMQLLSSDFCDEYDPILNYFNHLPTNFGGDPISKLADTMTVKEPELFKKYFKIWMVAVAAQAMNRKILSSALNHLCLVLTGAQNKGKSTWLNRLCPPVLDEYFYSGKLDLNNKDSLIMLASCFLINIDDQLSKIGRKHAEDIKTLITIPSIKERRPYARVAEHFPRIGSFMGSVNDAAFLYDATGSRRFLCFEIIDIDLAAQLQFNIDMAWAQAKSLYLSKDFKYWIDSDDTHEIETLNESYKVETAEETYLIKYFESCEANDPDNLEYSLTEIYKCMNDFFPNSGITPSSKVLGEMLKKHGFVQLRNSTKRWYNIKFTYQGHQKAKESNIPLPF